MNRKPFAVFFFVFVIAVVVSTDSSSSETDQAKRYLDSEDLEAINELLVWKKHKHSKHFKTRHCGRVAVKKLESLCPQLCSVADDKLYHDMCTSFISDNKIIERCCP